MAHPSRAGVRLSLALSAAVALGCPSPGGPGPGGAGGGLGTRRGGTAVRALHASADGAWLAWLEACAGTKAQSLPPDTASCDLYVVPSAGGAEPARVARAVTTLPGAILASPVGAEWAVLAEYDYASATGTLVRVRPGAGAGASTRALATGVSFFGYGPEGRLGFVAGGALSLAEPGGEPAPVGGVTEASSFELAAAAAGAKGPRGLVRRRGSAGGDLLALAGDGAQPEPVAAPVGDYAFGDGAYAFVRLGKEGGELLRVDATREKARPEVAGRKVRAFAFAPSGGALAFVADAVPGKQGDLRVRAGERDLALAKDVGEFRWAAQAPRLAWLEGYDPRVRSGVLGVGGLGGAGRTFGKNVSDFELSPDGRWVAFLQHTARAGYSVDLLVAPAEGEAKPRAVAQGAYGFAFSPDGKWLYYRDACVRNGEGCDLQRLALGQPGAKPEKLAEGMKSFEFDRIDPSRLLVTWRRMDRDALDLAVWSGGKLTAVDTYALAGSARFLPPDSRRVAYAVVLEKRAGVYVAGVP